ncbi:unnamed protein product [Ectocarpus sp. CCAP 1310/34]|nr:unnamed protein product [Ectocarpus sp. CCAP 1310/34]
MHYPRRTFLQNVPRCSDNMWLLGSLQRRQSRNSKLSNQIVLRYSVDTHSSNLSRTMFRQAY